MIGKEPIIVVGPSKSGTALMRSLLGNHSQVALAGETHYFDDLRPRMPGRDLSPEDRRQCEDYFLALGHRPYGHQGDPERSRLPRADLQRMVEEIGGGCDAYFEAYCRLYAAAEGASRWGEKTPRHIFRIPDIMQAFPKAKVVCMVRDPRAVVASYRDWKYSGGFDLEKDPGHKETLEEDYERIRKSYNILVATMMWRATVGAAWEGQRRFGPERVWIQQYERLVDDPEGTIRRISEWLELDFEPAMLEVPMLNSSVTQFQAKAGVSREALDRWRKKLSAREVAVIQRCAGGMMKVLEYPLEPVSVGLPAYAAEWGKVPFAVLRASAANRKRIANLPAYVWRRFALAMGRA